MASDQEKELAAPIKATCVTSGRAPIWYELCVSHVR